MNVSKKVLAALLVIAIIATAVAMAAIFVPAVGAWFSTNFGAVGAGLINVMQLPFKWALSGGGATTAAVWAIGFVVLLAFAYWVWHWDIGYKLTGAAQENKLTTYTTQREPEQPETLTSAQKAA